MRYIRSIFKNDLNQLRAGWDILLVIGASLALTLCGSRIVALHTDSGYLFDQQGWTRLFYGFGPYILVAVWFAVKVVHKHSLASIGLTRPDVKRLCTGSISGAFLLTAVIVIMLGVDLAELQGEWSNPHWNRIDITGMFITAFVAGICEEVLFRGYIQHLLSSRLSLFWGTLITSALFSLLHMANGDFTWISGLNIGLVALIFSVMTIRTGNLYFAITFHIAWNLFQGYVFSTPVSGYAAEGIYAVQLHGAEWLSGGGFGPEGSVITTLVLGLAFGLIIFVPVRGKTLSVKS
ncbi:CPBP family intramembrane glutamic endopeptidase [Paenibacillus sp. HW567]|uniref:CPBP family intramembrane glutamic endopeptidase n=1 Tax=Paenibacillus sp. HW567 TaxID=1034769 RepID=UPI00035D3116|nr:type II CAAX endopeptidase family protein [Paenibacillus sp. HW567]